MASIVKSGEKRKSESGKEAVNVVKKIRKCPPKPLICKMDKRIDVIRDRRGHIYMEPRNMVDAKLSDAIFAELMAIPRDERGKQAILRDGPSADRREWSPFPNRQYGVLSSRLLLTLGDPDKCDGYKFSGIKSPMHDWSDLEALQQLRKQLEERYGVKLGFAHCNLYVSKDAPSSKKNQGKSKKNSEEKGKKSTEKRPLPAWCGISRHQDDEDDLKVDKDGNTTIICYSVGASMMFEFAEGAGEKRSDYPPIARIWSEHGQVYVMAGKTQKHLWHGSAPPSHKTRKALVLCNKEDPLAGWKYVYERISVTFRVLAHA